MHEITFMVDTTWPKVHQNWAIGTGECSNFQGYLNKGKHVKKCCLQPGKYELTCLSHPRFGWDDGYLQIDGKTECEKLKENDFITKEISLCEGSCDAAPPAKLPECDNGAGVSVDIDMFVEARIQSTADKISWELSDSCKQNGYSKNTGTMNPVKQSKHCCIPKGKYKLSCSAGYFSWDRSWLEINGRKYKECFDVQGERTTNSRIVDFCNGKTDCPVFGTIETPKETTKPGTSISIGGGGNTIQLGGGNDGENVDDIIKITENGIEIDGVKVKKNSVGSPIYILGLLATLFLM